MAQKGLVNHYATLEVGEEADEETIKKTYRKLVLRWHPDKNPTDRAKAEEQIRLINAAYAVLSNPTKREKYDLQRCAVDKNRRGMAPAKPKVSPKMSVPKEFMMQPLGHPDRFLRCDGKKTSVPGRLDVQANFNDFFQATKLSLWWVPEVNNQCRIRALGSKARGDRRGAAAGLAGGLNLSFRVSGDAESEVILTPAEKGKRTESVDFMAKESPEYEGAFRFETACRRGYYLAFFPPTDLRVVPLLNEVPGRVLDFMLVDFSASLKYKDLEEVLLPAAEPHRGTFIPLSQLRGSKEVATYFKKVLQKPVWDAEDFAAYFEGHFVDWEYKASDQTVRLRPLDERLGQNLRCASSTSDATLAILSAGDELAKLPLAGALRAIKLLNAAQPNVDAKPKSKKLGSEVERLKLLRTLPDALSAAAEAPEEQQRGFPSAAEILDAAERMPSLMPAEPTPDILEHRRAAVRSLLDIAVARLAQSAESTPPRIEELLRTLRLPGAVSHDAALSKACAVALEKANGATLLQVVQKAAALGCESIVQTATNAAVQGLSAASPEDGAAAVASLARAGSQVERLAEALQARGANMSASVLAPAFLALCERDPGQEAVRPLAESLAAKAPWAGLSPETLLALAMAATKASSLGMLWDPVVQAAAVDTQIWDVAELVRLLLAVARGKEHVKPDSREALLTSAGSTLAPKLADMAAAELVKLLLALSGLGASALLEAAAKEAVIRLSDLSLPQLLLVTQGLARGLAPGHLALQQVLEFWPGKLKGAGGASKGGTDAGLSADQLVKLVVATSPVLKAGAAAAGNPQAQFLKAVGNQLVARVQELSEPNQMLVQAELAADGALASFHRKAELLNALTQQAKAQKASRKASRSPSPGGSAAAAKPNKKKKRRR